MNETEKNNEKNNGKGFPDTNEVPMTQQSISSGESNGVPHQLFSQEGERLFEQNRKQPKCTFSEPK